MRLSDIVRSLLKASKKSCSDISGVEEEWFSNKELLGNE